MSISSSFLSRRIKRTGDLLKVGASGQVLEYEERFESLRGLYVARFQNTLFLNSVIKEPVKRPRSSSVPARFGLLVWIERCIRDHFLT